MSGYYQLTDLACPPTSVGGSKDTIWVIPVRDVLSVPTSCDGSTLPAGETVQIRAGTKSAAYKLDFDSVRYREVESDSPDGPIYEVEITAFRRYINSGHIEQARRLAHGRFIIQHKDANGEIRVFGTLTRPMRYTSNADSGSNGQEKNGIAWRFFGTFVRPGIFLHPDTPPPNEVSYPTASFLITSDSLCQTTFNIAGSNTGDGTAIDGTTSGITLRYEFYYQGTLLYQSSIASNGDATLPASWTTTAGTRTVAQFQTDIIDEITAGGLGALFSFDMNTLTDALSGEDDLLVVLNIIEGQLHSDPVNQPLEQCEDRIHGPLHNNLHN